MIAAANNGELLIHCTCNPSGQLDFNMKSKQDGMLGQLEQHLQVMAQPAQGASAQVTNILDLF